MPRRACDDLHRKASISRTLCYLIAIPDIRFKTHNRGTARGGIDDELAPTSADIEKTPLRKIRNMHEELIKMGHGGQRGESSYRRVCYHDAF
mgnify:CR=1 FL=1